MEGRELNPYEQQLLAVFESCDQDESGSLDGHGLEQLCEKLQLEEQGFELIKCLIGSHTSNKRVTFSEFRDGLLALLAQDQGEQINRREGRDRSSPEREVSPKFVFGKKKYGRRSRPESTEQEVTLEQDESDDSDLDIFVPVGDENKDITMRSVAKASLDESEYKKKRKANFHSSSDRKIPALPESQASGVSEINLQGWQTSSESGTPTPSLGHVGENEEECLRAAWERLGVGKDGFLDRGELALVCECIGMEKVAEEVVQQLFEKLDVDRDGRISFEEFLLLFRNGEGCVQPDITQSPVKTKSSSERTGAEFQKHSDKTKERNPIGSSTDQDSHFLSLDPNSAGYVNAELIIEMWEAAGIPGPSRLLQDLGFNESRRLNIADLAAVLEEEIRSWIEEKRSEEAAGNSVHTYSSHETLLQATLALYQTEVRCLKLSLEHMSAERDKLRADLMDANQRASLLAQEVDDHHARLEKSSQLQVKLLEQRHAEQIKTLSEQLGFDREQLAVQNLSLEKQVSSLQEEENRLRTQVATLESENETLDKENHNLTEQLGKSEGARIQLQKELESSAGLQQRLSELEGSHEREEMLPLLERINELQAENTGLRDCNDELTMEVEVLSAKLASLKTRKHPALVSHDSSEGTNVSDGSGITSVISATKRRGNSPLVLATEDSSEEESPRLGKMRRCCDGISVDRQDVSLETVNMEGLQIHPLAHGESGIETDLDVDDYAESAFDEGEMRITKKDDLKQMNSEILVLPNKVESETIASLRVYIAKLEHELKLKSEKLVVFEAEQSQLRANLAAIVPEEDVNKPKISNEEKDSLKQVSSTVVQSRENSGSISSPEHSSSQNQRTELPDLTDGDLVSKATNFSFINNALPFFINGIISDPLENAKDVEQLEKHCRDLKSQLDLVKIEIVKILSEKKACSKENCALKNHISDLKNRLPTDNSLHLPAENMFQIMPLPLECHNVIKDSVTQRRPVQVGTENIIETEVQETASMVSDSSGSDTIKADISVNSQPLINEEEISKRMKEEEEKHLKEITVLKERCSELENSLELLRQEYEKCEDYWANKLEEERHLYDQEQRLSDEKFSELMSKIKEYEEMLGGQDDHSEDSDRLSTIEERASLEKQFTDLEEEFEEFRQRVEIEQTEKDEAIQQLREQVKVMEQQNKHTGNKLNVAVQVSDLENGSWESDRTFVVELDGARKVTQHDNDTQRSNKIFMDQRADMINGYSNVKNKMPLSSRSSSPQSGPSTYSENVELRSDLVHLHNLREQLDEECQVLRQKKESLLQEILDIQAGKTHINGSVGMPFSLPPHWSSNSKVGGQACRIDLNVLQAMNARLRHQEQQCQHMQLALKQQQKQSEGILKCTWQKHKEEVVMLKSDLHSTQQKLNQQASACKELMDRLARTDLLVKDLYVENACLAAAVQRL